MCTAGYVSTGKDGGAALTVTALHEALLEARGVEPDVSGKVGRGGRRLSSIATVQGKGSPLIGTASTALWDLRPGDEVEIKIGRQQTRLIPAGASEDDRDRHLVEASMGRSLVRS
ncbi:AbrB-like transcriptional regulator [Cyanobium sp. Morenito 9A2]|uniref:AbrB-like transcriptional regulator n=1 Tax=Cyanobium sp. Morenito 9A2 TaxID=2823718 RepID=UPI0020CCF38A|nr:AbrB-like transcriptional regulator [Cyanobium sp. Morenito 9A2]MCP9848461.1 AbrB family transcriptional regulator [Cyanobium sp. Morenito 9A2]